MIGVVGGGIATVFSEPLKIEVYFINVVKYQN